MYIGSSAINWVPMRMDERGMFPEQLGRALAEWYTVTDLPILMGLTLAPTDLYHLLQIASSRSATYTLPFVSLDVNGRVSRARRLL